jgi:hypothetical protein
VQKKLPKILLIWGVIAIGSHTTSIAQSSGVKSSPERIAEFKHHYKGSITKEKVDKFIADRPPGSIKKLIISSDGGSASAGLVLAQWVRRNNLDVEVYLQCHSACANLVFMAGNRKIIGEHSFVSFHGSVEQKDLRALLSKYVQTLEKSFFAESELTGEDKEFLSGKRESIATIMKFRELEKVFYDELQINEYITRLGQEPVAYKLESWTMTVRAMEKFGVQNVSAPEGYGTPAYMKRLPTQTFTCNGKCMTFDVDDRGNVVRTDDN